jgi:hypothetical protein
LNVQIINPIEHPNWDELLLTNDQTTFFHTAAWAKVLNESYNYKPLYFSVIENGNLSALIPIMEVSSFLTGKRGVSLPFTDYCRPIADNNGHLNGTTQKVIQYGRQAGWKSIELRGALDASNQTPAAETFIDHSVDLSLGEQKVFRSFRASTRRNIQSAISADVGITFDNSWNTVRDFYHLNCKTRKYHGLPPQSKLFFKNVFDHILSQNKGCIALALYRGIPIAGAVFFHFGRQAIFKYGASIRKYHHLRPNNLIMWQAIRRYIEEGYRFFSFGKTEPANKGLLQFKDGWGTQERTIYYYRYDLAKNAFVSTNKTLKSSYNLFKVMPLPLLRLTGNFLYRHVG